MWKKINFGPVAGEQVTTVGKMILPLNDAWFTFYYTVHLYMLFSRLFPRSISLWIELLPTGATLKHLKFRIRFVTGER